jgi:hypothetical protein
MCAPRSERNSVSAFGLTSSSADGKRSRLQSLPLLGTAMRRAALVVLTLALAHEARRSDCGYRTCTACYKKGDDKCGWCSKSNKCVVVAETDCSDYAPSSCVCDYAYKKMFPGKTMGSDGPCLQAFSHNFAAGTCSASNTACIDAVSANLRTRVPTSILNNCTLHDPPSIEGQEYGHCVYGQPCAGHPKKQPYKGYDVRSCEEKND